MRTISKRYPELVDNNIQTIEVAKAKRGLRSRRDEAKELHDLLRTYTYRLIGLGNAFRRIAGDFSALDGSNWRNNRHVALEVQELAAKLYTMSPDDVTGILEIENRLEAIVTSYSEMPKETEPYPRRPLKVKGKTNE